MQSMVRMHQAMLWVHFGVMVLGCWLLASPWTLGYNEAGNWGVNVAQVTAERGLSPPASRAWLLTLSDMACGFALLAFGGLSLFFRHRWAQWGSCFTGLWLLAAPAA